MVNTNHDDLDKCAFATISFLIFECEQEILNKYNPHCIFSDLFSYVFVAIAHVANYLDCLTVYDHF